MRNCLLNCSFTLCKIYTYLELLYKEHCAKYIDYYINNDLDINQSFIDYNDEEFYINTLVTKDNKVLATMNSSSTFNQCNYTFLNITLIYNNKEYIIELKNSLWDFYCVDNKIDYKFLHWYMTYIYNVSDFDTSYTCNILDNNYNFTDFDKNSYIKLEKDSYVKN